MSLWIGATELVMSGEQLSVRGVWAVLSPEIASFQISNVVNFC